MYIYISADLSERRACGNTTSIKTQPTIPSRTPRSLLDTALARKPGYPGSLQDSSIRASKLEALGHPRIRVKLSLGASHRRIPPHPAASRCIPLHPAV